MDPFGQWLAQRHEDIERQIEQNKQNLTLPLNAGDVVHAIDAILDSLASRINAGSVTGELATLNELTLLRNQIVHGKFPSAWAASLPDPEVNASCVRCSGGAPRFCACITPCAFPGCGARPGK